MEEPNDLDGVDFDFSSKLGVTVGIADGAVKAGVDSDFFLLLNGSTRCFFLLGDNDVDEDDDITSFFS